MTDVQSLVEAIKGYSQEKLILSERLGQLPTNNNSICTRGSIEKRLREIDEAIAILTKK